jgi:hypothetical protein
MVTFMGVYMRYILALLLAISCFFAAGESKAQMLDMSAPTVKVGEVRFILKRTDDTSLTAEEVSMGDYILTHCKQRNEKVDAVRECAGDMIKIAQSMNYLFAPSYKLIVGTIVKADDYLFNQARVAN